MKQILAGLLLQVITIAGCCVADGIENSRLHATPTPGNAPVIKGSNASFDKRLPPFLPGERVIANGKEMRVWTTSGGVASSAAPQVPQSAQDQRIINEVAGNGNLIIDTGEHERRKDGRD